MTQEYYQTQVKTKQYLSDFPFWCCNSMTKCYVTSVSKWRLISDASNIAFSFVDHFDYEYLIDYLLGLIFTQLIILFDRYLVIDLK